MMRWLDRLLLLAVALTVAASVLPLGARLYSDRSSSRRTFAFSTSPRRPCDPR